MRGSRWSASEVVIVLYFSSRQLFSKSIHFLLLRRGFRRSDRAISAKVIATLRQNPSLKPRIGTWDLRVVDRWIDDLVNNHDFVNKLIKFTAVDFEDVSQNQSISQLLKALGRSIVTVEKRSETTDPEIVDEEADICSHGELG